mgnify:CR=1 FL=1
MNEVLHIGLCDGRHPIVQNASLLDANGTYQPNPTAGEDMGMFVFPAEVDDPLAFDKFRETVYNFINGPFDELFDGDGPSRVYLYVTGLSTLLTSFLWVWVHNDYLWNKLPLVLMHYDRDSGQYKEEYWG